MIDTDVLKDVVLFGSIAVLIAFFIFKDSIQSSGLKLRLFPASGREWIGYWFHTCEFLTCCCVLMLSHPDSWRVDLHDSVLFLALSLFVILLVSAVLFWRHERALARGGLLWAGIAFIGSFLIPVIPCTR